MEFFESRFTAMACDNQVQLYVADRRLGEDVAARVIDEVKRIEAKYSRYRADSLLSRINQAAGVAPVAIDEETFALLRHAQACFELSGGLFDITSGVLRRAWDFKAATPPSDDALKRILPLIGWDKVELTATSVFLSVSGMEIDFGGIGKEYAVDRASAVLAAHGIDSALVSLGGDVRVLGARPDGSGWPIYIAHPRKPGVVLGAMPLALGSLATSGDYMRYFDYDGRRYCHVLHPKTGQPAHTWQSVTVVSALCIDAGSITTIAMLMEESAKAFIANRNENALLVDQAGKISVFGLFEKFVTR
jgi:thiamine biosynthesis lipoprotein